jgi:hypothetical protein
MQLVFKDMYYVLDFNDGRHFDRKFDVDVRKVGWQKRLCHSAFVSLSVKGSDQGARMSF